MKKLIGLLIILATCCWLTGCMFFPTSQRTVHYWQNRVAKMLPVGTPTEEVYRILKQNGFGHGRESGGGIDCEKDTGFNLIIVELRIENGKLASPPVTAVWRSGGF